MLNDLDQDIRDHTERETHDDIDRGMSAEEARYAALRKFGNVTRVKEIRGVWSVVGLESLVQNVRYCIRQGGGHLTTPAQHPLRLTGVKIVRIHRTGLIRSARNPQDIYQKKLPKIFSLGRLDCTHLLMFFRYKRDFGGRTLKRWREKWDCRDAKSVARGPPGIALNTKTNLRSDLESTKSWKKRTRDEPERTRAGVDGNCSSSLESVKLLGMARKRIENEPETNLSRETAHLSFRRSPPKPLRERLLQKISGARIRG
jgi:hypothetical protein